MIYVFDTSSLSKLKHFYPDIFKSVWQGLEVLIQQGKLISTREVWKEMERGNADQYTNEWFKRHKEILLLLPLLNCYSLLKSLKFHTFRC